MSDDRKPVKLPAALWESLKRRQYAVREATGVEPTQGALLTEAWAAYLAALANPTVNNSLPPPPPQPDILDALNAIARKLGAAKAELDALIERSNGGGHDDQVALLAASDATTARARALVAEVGRGPGVPGGIEGNGEETTGSDGAGAGAGVPGRPRVTRAK